jgi:hypothetical protein
MSDSPTFGSIGYLNEVLDMKIREMNELRQFLSR